jgi:hypothetical protein
LVTLASAQSYPEGIAVDSTAVYWTNLGTSTSGGSVNKMPKSGGTLVSLASAQSEPYWVAVDGVNVYWTSAQSGAYSVPILGGQRTQLAGYLLNGLAIDNSYLYTAYLYYSGDPFTITRVPLSGGSLTTLSSASIGSIAGVAVDTTSVYWVGSTAAMKTSLGGGVGITLCSVQGSPYAVALDSSNLYWSNSATSGAIMSVPVNGGNANTIASGQNTPKGIAIDSQYIYWTNYGSNTVMKAPLAGGTPITLASNQHYPWAIAVDDTSVYFTTVGDGTIMKVTPK